MRPDNFDDFVGQKTAKTQLSILMASARHRQDAVPHILFSGPSGTGKSTAARIVAGSYEYQEVNAATITSTKDLLELLSKVEENSVLFLDEIHALRNKMQEAMYTVMEDFVLEVKEGSYIHREPIPRFTLIGATTHLGELNLPFRNRFRAVIEFEEYSLDELAVIVQRVAKANLKLKLSDAYAKIIAATCKNNPRNVISRTEFVRDWIVMKSVEGNCTYADVCSTITQEVLLEIIELSGYDKNGLSSLERKYIDCVKKKGPVSLATIADTLGITDANVLAIEPYLTKMGLVEKTGRGRVLNSRAYRELIQG